MIRYSPSPIPAARSQKLLADFARTGCERAFAELVELHRPAVLATCLRIIKNHADADDAAQAVFLTLALEVRGGATITNLSPWLRQVARRVALDQYRSKARRRKREADLSVASDTFSNDTILSSAAGRDLPNELEQQELRDILQKALAELPSKYRSAMVLFYFGGLSLPEIATQLNVRSKTLGVRLLRARRMLATRLAKTPLAASLCLSGVFVHAHLHELLTQVITRQSIQPSMACTSNATFDGLAHVVGGSQNNWTQASVSPDLVQHVLPVARMFRRVLRPRNVAVALACSSLTGAGMAGGVGSGLADELLPGIRRAVDRLNILNWTNPLPTHLPRLTMPMPMPSLSDSTTTQDHAQRFDEPVLLAAAPLDLSSITFSPTHFITRASAARPATITTGSPIHASWGNANPRGSASLPVARLNAAGGHQTLVSGEAGIESDFMAFRHTDGVAASVAQGQDETEFTLAFGAQEIGGSFDGLASTAVSMGDSSNRFLPAKDAEGDAIQDWLPEFDPTISLPPVMGGYGPGSGAGTNGGTGVVPGKLPVGVSTGSPIPEPGALLVVLGLGGALLRRRRVEKR